LRNISSLRAPARGPPPGAALPADTLLADTLLADTLLADTLLADTGRVSPASTVRCWRA
jgi:hypothetical protein